MAAALLLVASAAGPSLAAVPAQAGVASDGGSAAPADVQNRVDVTVTQEYSLRPSEPGYVTVELVVSDEDARKGMDLSLPHSKDRSVQILDASGFLPGDEKVTDLNGPDPSSVTYSLEINGTGSPREIASPSWAFFQRPPADAYDDGTDVGDMHVDYQWQRTVAEGATHERWTYLGPYESATERAAGAEIRVISSEIVPSADPPQRIAGALAERSAVLTAGEHDESVTGFGLPDVPGAQAGQSYGGLYVSDETFLINAPSNSVYDLNNGWTHEYMHTTDALGVKGKMGPNMSWFTEGYAVYATHTTSIQTGYGDFGVFKDASKKGVQSAVLAKDTTWKDGTPYDKGGLVLKALDRRIRLESDGQFSLQDVVADMRAHDEPVSSEDFALFVAERTNWAYYHTVEGWIETSASPDPDSWTYEEHVDAYGPAPRVEVRAAVSNGMADLDPIGSRTYASRTGEATVDVTLENSGGAPAHYRLSSSQDGTGDEVHYGTAAAGSVEELGLHSFQGHLNGSSATTRVHTVRYDLATWTGDSGGELVDVAVLRPEEEVIRAGGAATSPAESILVSEGSLLVVTDAPSAGVFVTPTGSDEQVLAGMTDRGVYRIGPGQDALQTGTSYEVDLDSPNEPQSQYVTVLASVNGTVPHDVDQDGEFMDLDGDGDVDDDDVAVYYQHMNDPALTDYPRAYDYSGNGQIDNQDVTIINERAS